MTLPHVIDSTMIGDYRTCPERFYRSYIENLSHRDRQSFDLTAGTALHRGLYRARVSFYESRDLEKAKIDGLRELILAYGPDDPPPAKANKALDRILAAYEGYWERYPLETDSVQVIMGTRGPMVEQCFSIPLPVMHPDGQPMCYGGRIDWLAKFADGIYCVDEKTTGYMGPTWGDGWDLRGQFLGYMWAANQFGFPVKGTIIRGIKLLTNSVGFQETIVYYKEWLVSQWLEELLDTIQRIVSDYSTGRWAKVFHYPCSDYGGCEFRALCSTNNPEKWVDTLYKPRDWSPLKVVA